MYFEIWDAMELRRSNRWLAILLKALFILAALFGQVLTYFPGLVGSLGAAGCMPYHLLWDLGGRKN